MFSVRPSLDDGAQALKPTASAAAANLIHVRNGRSPSGAWFKGARSSPQRQSFAEHPMPPLWTAIAPILLLIASNVFMTFAWYGQLKVEGRAMWLIVLISWGIAFFEYWLGVPGNRDGGVGVEQAGG